MKIGVVDGSNYLKGLLLLVRKDSRISEEEVRLTRRIGKALGFECTFCDNAIREILENKYILDAPPEFSTKKLAVKFIKDGLALAFSDNDVHPSEEAWLRSTAEKNGLGLRWFRHVLANTRYRNRLRSCLEVDSLLVEYA